MAPGNRASQGKPCLAAWFIAVSAGLFGGLVFLTLIPNWGGAQPTFWAAAVYLAGLHLIARGLRYNFPYGAFGLCNTITLTRFTLVAALVAATVAGVGPSWYVVALATLALALDGADGYAARRQEHVSAFGARFDMEVDAALALVLALNAAISAPIGWIVLSIGLPRYVFAVAGLALPWLQGALPDSVVRKTVCVLQLSGLLLLQAPGLPDLAGPVIVVVIAVLLAGSFLKDILWLHRRKPA